MNTLRKVAVGLTALFALSACSFFGASESAAKYREKLEAADYKVTYMTASEYEESQMGETFPTTVGFEEYIGSYKVTNDGQPGSYLYVWFFDSIDHASTFSDLYSTHLLDLKTSDGAKFTTGTKNNAVWCGTNDAAKVVGLNSIF